MEGSRNLRKLTRKREWVDVSKPDKKGQNGKKWLTLIVNHHINIFRLRRKFQLKIENFVFKP